jgi:hypothetical protein
MISKVMSSIVPKSVPKAIMPAAEKGTRLKKFLQNETFGKVLDVAAENQTLCQSLFALGICIGPRPVTNYIVTEDKKDATYANCHSISSGMVGFVWPLIFATPIAVGIKRMVANPTKYFKPEIIQKFYPNVGTVKELAKDGKTMVTKIATNAEGKMLRRDGSVLCTDLEPLMVYGKEAQAKFAKEHPELTVDKTGVVRSKSVFKTENGVYKLDKDGNKIGVAVQKTDFNPITEEMEIGAKKEQNVQKFINMVPDILLAPIRASLTIALIPPLLDAFGIKKSNKNAAGKGLNVVSQANNFVPQRKADHVATTFSAFKKGGV